MKKFLAALIVAGSLFVTSISHASIETYTGEGSATMSEAETQDKAVDRAKLKALRAAQEKAGVYIRSQSRMRDLELVEDDVETITAGIVKIINTNVKKTVLNDDVIQVFVTVTVQIDTDDLQREIDKLLDKRKPKPPVDRPKPIEQPKPQPVEEPKPEKVEPHPEKIEQPAEESAPVEEPKPAEPIEPTPAKIEQPAEEPKPEKVEPQPEKIEQPAEHGIQTFESVVRYNQKKSKGIVGGEFLIMSAEQRVYIKAKNFVVNYCAKRNYKLTEKQIRNFVEQNLQIVDKKHSTGSRTAKVTAKIDMGKLDAWIKNHDA